MTGSDDLDVFVDSQLRDPAFAAAYDDARARAALLAGCVDARKASGRTQAEIAVAMGTTQSAISDLENGTTDPRLSTLQRYARAVGVEIAVSLRLPTPAA